MLVLSSTDGKSTPHRPQSFDAQVKELASSGKLSASKVKSITDAAMANIEVCTNCISP